MHQCRQCGRRELHLLSLQRGTYSVYLYSAVHHSQQFQLLPWQTVTWVWLQLGLVTHNYFYCFKYSLWTYVLMYMRATLGGIVYSMLSHSLDPVGPTDAYTVHVCIIVCVWGPLTHLCSKPDVGHCYCTSCHLSLIPVVSFPVAWNNLFHCVTPEVIMEASWGEKCGLVPNNNRLVNQV